MAPGRMHAVPLLAGLLLAGCGSVSGLTRESSTAPARIADYDRVEVMDFGASDSTRFDDPAKTNEHASYLREAQATFAGKIADAIAATGVFKDVSRSAGSGPALRVSGDISRFDRGNVVARGLTGFAGQTHFDARIDIADARSGQSLASLTVDRNSWPLPVGASLSTLQTTDHFMREAAKKVAEELAAKKTGAVSR